MKKKKQRKTGRGAGGSLASQPRNPRPARPHKSRRRKEALKRAKPSDLEFAGFEALLEARHFYDAQQHFRTRFPLENGWRESLLDAYYRAVFGIDPPVRLHKAFKRDACYSELGRKFLEVKMAGAKTPEGKEAAQKSIDKLMKTIAALQAGDVSKLESDMYKDLLRNAVKAEGEEEMVKKVVKKKKATKPKKVSRCGLAKAMFEKDPQASLEKVAAVIAKKFDKPLDLKTIRVQRMHVRRAKGMPTVIKPDTAKRKKK